MPPADGATGARHAFLNGMPTLSALPQDTVMSTDTRRTPRDRKPDPKLPHEHDQSVADQTRDQSKDAERTRKAFEDVQSGNVDTGLQPVIESTDRQLRGSNDH